jgi:hypothetical protein
VNILDLSTPSLLVERGAFDRRDHGGALVRHAAAAARKAFKATALA